MKQCVTPQKTKKKVICIWTNFEYGFHLTRNCHMTRLGWYDMWDGMVQWVFFGKSWQMLFKMEEKNFF